ncbi:MAG TPA: dioxygenase [Paenibacillaceae bacterium]|nr:dioxygenase [Paenibacillaceae bacterium]
MMPSLFIAHGAPTLVLEDNTYTRFLKEYARNLPKPKAIILFTAHWESPVPLISGVQQYDMIYDFYGFPDEMYRMVYSAKGDPNLAIKIQEAFSNQGINSQIDVSRGIDHGAWVVLQLLYPQADIPVVVLSVNPALSPGEQYNLGKALSKLREEDILIIGSGGTVHNLRAVNWRGTSVDNWAMEFEDWIKDHVEKWDLPPLFDYEKKAPFAAQAVPRNEHFIPLLLAMGAADSSRHATLLYREFQFGNLSLTCWKFD